MRNNKMSREFLLLVLVIAPSIYAVLMWTKMPDIVPVHWNLKGEVDGYGSRHMVLGLTAGLSIFIYALMALIPKLAVRKESFKQLGKTYFKLRVILQLFFAMLSVVIVYSTMNSDTVDIGMLITLCMAVFMILLGNYMGKFRPNYFMGIRTPWTLSNDTVWAKTHRLAGWMWVVGGLITFLVPFAVPASSITLT
ncbi:MAG: DUF1648 domain-containing protein [Aureispira sp.]|nr:DUF1648 domain-containing protein [Aureispira sp.]